MAFSLFLLSYPCFVSGRKLIGRGIHCNFRNENAFCWWLANGWSRFQSWNLRDPAAVQDSVFLCLSSKFFLPHNQFQRYTCCFILKTDQVTDPLWHLAWLRPSQTCKILFVTSHFPHKQDVHNPVWREQLIKHSGDCSLRVSLNQLTVSMQHIMSLYWRMATWSFEPSTVSPLSYWLH